MIEPCAVPVTSPARGPEDRVVRLRRERPERRCADVRPHRIRAVFGARRRVRQVVAPLALDHPRAFDPARVPLLVELANPFPGVGVGRERDELLRLSNRAGRVGRVELDAVDSPPSRCSPSRRTGGRRHRRTASDRSYPAGPPAASGGRAP